MAGGKCLERCLHVAERFDAVYPYGSGRLALMSLSEIAV